MEEDDWVEEDDWLDDDCPCNDCECCCDGLEAQECLSYRGWLDFS
jgi:hypothetical protein